MAEQDRSCWVCFATDEDDGTAEWVHPCRCRGSIKWVHRRCLQYWVDEKQRGDDTAVACPQCNAEYLIVLPKLGPVAYVLDLIDRKLTMLSVVVIEAGIIYGSFYAFYWTAMSYGTFTVMQVVGHAEGLDVIEHANPLLRLIGLPTIPFMLILGNMIHWEDYVLRQWRKHINKLQILNSIFPGLDRPVPHIPAAVREIRLEMRLVCRVLCGALALPTISTIVGKLMFSSVNSNLKRTILGGIAFVAIKGAVNVYLKQQKYLRKAHRKIPNFPVPEEE